MKLLLAMLLRLQDTFSNIGQGPHLPDLWPQAAPQRGSGTPLLQLRGDDRPHLCSQGMAMPGRTTAWQLCRATCEAVEASFLGGP